MRTPHVLILILILTVSDELTVFQLEIITLSDTSRTGNRIVDEGVEAPSYQCRGPRTQDFLKPGPSYIAPEPGFFFGQGTQQTSLIDFLPSRLAADRLIKQYFMYVYMYVVGWLVC